MYLVVLRAYLSYFCVPVSAKQSGHSLPVSTKHFCREICRPLGIFYISFVSLITCNKEVGFFGVLCMYLKRTKKIKWIHAKWNTISLEVNTAQRMSPSCFIFRTVFVLQIFYFYFFFGKLEFKEQLNRRRCRAKAQVRHVICPCLHFYVSSTNFTCFVFIDSSSFLSFPSWPAIFPPVYS